MSKYRLYHYTTVENLKKILESRQFKAIEEIKGTPVESMIFLSCEKKGDCAVNFDGVHIPTARIEVKGLIPGIIKWNKIKAQERIPKIAFEYMDYLGTNKKGNPNNWRISYSPILSTDWLRIEILKDGQWIQCDKNGKERIHRPEERRRTYLETFGDKPQKYFNMRQWI